MQLPQSSALCAAARALIGGGLYGAVAFGAGIGLGAARSLWLAARVSAAAATLIESTLLLLACWWTSRAAVRLLGVASTLRARATMGGAALGVLLFAEYAVAVWVFGGSFGSFSAALLSLSGLIGLLVQVLFASFPALQLEGRTAAP